MKGTSTTTERQGIQVIARAASILRALEQNPEGYSLTALANQVGLARSTVQRIVDSLSNEALAFTGMTGGRIRLGPLLLPLAAATRFPVTERVRPILSAVADETGETVALGVAEANHILFADCILAGHRVTSNLEIGDTLPLHCSASGKAILAAMTGEELSAIKKKIVLKRLTEHTITTWSSLEKELAKIRVRKVSVDDQEHSEGISSLAVAFSIPGESRCTLAITLPTQRYHERKKELSQVLLHALGMIEKRMN